MAGNPYAFLRTREEGEAPGPVALVGDRLRYAVPTTPDDSIDGYSEEDSPQLGQPDTPSVPDPIRTGRLEPLPNTDNDRRLNAAREADFHARHADESTVTGWTVDQQKVPAGQNPLWTQERAPIRPTADLSPDGYRFTRPWHIPRNVKDAVSEEATTHISMADHRRVFEIYGMRAHGRVGVNTFRLDPQPWDAGLYPAPNAIAPEPNDPGGFYTNAGGFRL